MTYTVSSGTLNSTIPYHTNFRNQRIKYVFIIVVLRNIPTAVMPHSFLKPWWRSLPRYDSSLASRLWYRTFAMISDFWDACETKAKLTKQNKTKTKTNQKHRDSTEADSILFCVVEISVFRPRFQFVQLADWTVIIMMRIAYRIV